MVEADVPRLDDVEDPPAIPATTEEDIVGPP